MGGEQYRPYPAYKDSGVEWLGEIPAHWEVKRLKYAAPLRISKLDAKPEDATYIGLENIESWTGRLLIQDQPESCGEVLWVSLRLVMYCLANCVSIPCQGCPSRIQLVSAPAKYLPYVRWSIRRATCFLFFTEQVI